MLSMDSPTYFLSLSNTLHELQMGVSAPLLLCALSFRTCLRMVQKTPPRCCFQVSGLLPREKHVECQQYHIAIRHAASSSCKHPQDPASAQPCPPVMHLGKHTQPSQTVCLYPWRTSHVSLAIRVRFSYIPYTSLRLHISLYHR